MRAALLPLLVVSLLPVGCRGAASCAQCGREECRNLAVRATLPDGSTLDTCCPRCALRALREKGRTPVRLTVRDWETSTPLVAAAASFVEGSDVSPCAMTPADPPRDERGCCLLPVYDRCSPSLLAFSAPERAREFAAVHGGTLRSWQELAAAP